MPTEIFLSTPCYGGHCTKQYAASILNLQTEGRKHDISIRLDTTENESLITRARNMSVARFMRSEAPYLLFIDADIHFQPEAVFQAIAADEDIVVSPYPKKRIVWEQGEREIKEGDGTKNMDRVTSDLVINVTEQRAVIEKDRFVNVLDGGTGFMLIKRSVIEKMIKQYPELECINDHPGVDIKEYYAVFDCMIDPDTKRYLSEDYAFCRRWQMMGGSIKMNIDSTLGHIGTIPFTFNLKQRLRTLNKIK